MLSIILVASIAVAVVLGYKTKINTGFFCIAFAYLIGCFGMGIKTKELISFWPVSTMFVILSVSLFYNFAAVVAFRAKCKIFSRHLQKPILKTEKGRFKGL